MELIVIGFLSCSNPSYYSDCEVADATTRTNPRSNHNLLFTHSLL